LEPKCSRIVFRDLSTHIFKTVPGISLKFSRFDENPEKLKIQALGVYRLGVNKFLQVSTKKLSHTFQSVYHVLKSSG